MNGTDYEVLTDEIATLRAAFFEAVPQARDDQRFPEMMGSPWSVLQYVTAHFAEQAKADDAVGTSTLSPVTVACAISALRVAHDSLNEPSVHFSVEVQREAQAEIVAALAELQAIPAAIEQPTPPTPAVLDAMDRLLDRLVGMFDDDANNMPDQLLDDYLAARAWVDAQPVGWKGGGDG